MNKTTLVTLIALTIVLCNNCKNVKKAINIEQKTTNREILILFNKEYEKVVLIEFPIKLKLSNNSMKKREFTSIEYDYYPFDKGIRAPLYYVKNNQLIRLKQSIKKKIAPYQNKEYLIYTRHRVDTSEYIQKHFTVYIDKMLKLNQDSLLIGTVSNFKNKHGSILKLLTNKDSVYVNLWESEDIGVPVKY